ncbi:MAG: glycosyltransferase family 4 protein [Bdellovibrionales bacterium]|nr:glycosyltransferase family 4 protein [Bdellovibrionales bacterium]
MKAAPGKKANRIAIFAATNQSVWESCKIISGNLAKAYQRQFKDAVRFFPYNLTMIRETQRFSGTPILDVAEQLHAFAPSKVIFMDYQPAPYLMLAALRWKYGKDPLPGLNIHVYGDFPIHLHEWKLSLPYISKQKLRFICASPKQARFISGLLAPGSEVPTVSPFPVDPNEYFFDPKDRAEFRKKHGIPTDAPVLCYSGRISLQKNVIALLNTFAETQTKSKKPAWFLIAGNFDPLASPYFGIQALHQSYFEMFEAALAKLPKSIRARVIVLGNLGKKDLRQLYSASDVLGSLSLHQDEDYGMSPAEALCTGATTVLTDWAGYGGFGKLSACSLSPVILNKTGQWIQKGLFEKALLERLNEGFDEKRRLDRARLAVEFLGIETVSKGLAKTLLTDEPKFMGFDWKFDCLKQSFDSGSPFPAGPKANSFYSNIYGNYYEKSFQ